MPGPRVRVYRNLHTGTLSMQAYNPEKKGWRVISHPFQVKLQDVKFVVNEGGRQRVLKEKRKNVHAWIEGNLISYETSRFINEAKYNPYKYDFWTDPKSGHRVETAAFCSVNRNGEVTYTPNKWSY